MKDVLQDKDELQKEIRKLKEEAEAVKKKRERIVTAVFSFIFFLVFYFSIKPDNLGDIFTYALSSVLWASLHVAIHNSIFEWLYDPIRANHAWIDILKKKQDN